MKLDFVPLKLPHLSSASLFKEWRSVGLGFAILLLIIAARLLLFPGKQKSRVARLGRLT
jgi:hypothetical protein